MSEQFGLTQNGKARTRPLRSSVTAGMPPAVSPEEAPGYLYYPDANLWVYMEDFAIVIEVAQEVSNPDIKSRHGTRTTKNRGCGGPLCRKALRDNLYGGARSLRFQRIEDLLTLLQERHNEVWFNSLPQDERERLEASATRIMDTMQQKLNMLKTG